MVWVSKSEIATTFNHSLVVCAHFTFVLGFYTTCFCSVNYLYYILNVILRFLKKGLQWREYFNTLSHNIFLKKILVLDLFRILISWFSRVYNAEHNFL